jgi:hypothetical protein
MRVLVLCLLLGGCASFDTDSYCVERNWERCVAWQIGKIRK